MPLIVSVKTIINTTNKKIKQRSIFHNKLYISSYFERKGKCRVDQMFCAQTIECEQLVTRNNYPLCWTLANSVPEAHPSYWPSRTSMDWPIMYPR